MRNHQYSFQKDLEAYRKLTVKIHSPRTEWYDIHTRLTGAVERITHKQVASSNRSNKTVLEIGVGGGEHVKYEDLTGNGRKYFAVDYDIDHVIIARRQYPIKAVNADGAHLPFRENVFDSCIANGVLEHVVELEKLLLEVRAVVKNGGDFFVVIPTNGSLLIAVFKWLVSYPNMYLRGIKRPDYIWHYSNVNDLKRIMCLLEKHFFIHKRTSVPFKFLSWRLSPLYFIHCKNNK